MPVFRAAGDTEDFRAGLQLAWDDRENFQFAKYARCRNLAKGRQLLAWNDKQAMFGQRRPQLRGLVVGNQVQVDAFGSGAEAGIELDNVHGHSLRVWAPWRDRCTVSLAGRAGNGHGIADSFAPDAINDDNAER